MYSDADKHFMSLALHEAHTALAAGDYPVGAALAVNGELWDTAIPSPVTWYHVPNLIGKSARWPPADAAQP